jgi:DNA mismatch repair protein MutS
LSIAWATVEHLHGVNRCRALFATHFHELTALAAGRLDRLHNATVRVKEWQGDVVFLHEVVAGAADRSYGIQVAKLAGLPSSVIERAKVVLAKLEQEDRAAPKGFEDLPLFAAPAKPVQDKTASAEELLAAALAAINPDDLSPREAMDALYRLKQQAAKKTGN